MYGNKGLEDMERISLIDVSSEDDLLISSSAEGLPPMLQSLDLSEKCNGNQCFGLSEVDSTVEEESPGKYYIQMEQASVFSGSPEPKRGTSCKYNLRKSLAWDNAFLTSAGVLDPEELAVVNSTFKKTEVNVLPGIQEDIRRSNESTSTFESDNWALESLEVDLFEHLRASIQKSQGKCNEASTMAHSSNTTASEKRDAPGSHSSQHIEISSKNKIKPPTASRRHDGSASKQCLKQITEVANAQVIKAAPKAVDQKSLLKPPRIASRIPTVPNKTISAPWSVQIKTNIGKGLPGDVGSSQSNVASRKLNRGDTCSVTTRCSPSLRNSSGSPSSSRVLPAASSSSFGKSGSTPSIRTSKPQREDLRRKVDASSLEFSSDSVDKVPLRIVKSKNGLRNAKAPLNSTLKLFSRTSPNSSIDSMASESSSSSSSTARKPNSSTETLNIRCSSPCLLVSSYSDVQIKANIGTTETVVMSQHENQASPGNHVLIDSSAPDSSRNSINSNSRVRSFKPSSLRMPTPKIGYFDAKKSLPRNSNRCVSTGSQVLLNRNASKINNVGASKPKPSSKLQPAHGVNCNFQQTGPQQLSPSRERSIPPATVQVSEASLQVTGGTPRAVGNYHDRCSILLKDSSPGTNEKTSEVQPGVTSDCGWLSDLSANKHENQHHLYLETPISFLNNKDDPVIFSNGRCDGSLKPAEASRIGKETLVEHSSSSLDNNSFLVPKLSEKENLSPSACRLIDLSRDLESKNLNVVLVELTGEQLSSLSLSDVNGFDNASNLKVFPHPYDSIIQDEINVGFSPRTPTPLADDYCNRSGLFNSRMESTVKSMNDTSVFLFPAKGVRLQSPHGNAIPDAKLVQENAAISSVPYEDVFNRRDHTVRGSDAHSVS